MTERLYPAASKLLPAIAFGDAAGLPTEGKSVEEIRLLYGEITELVPPAHHPFFRHADRGQTSDDTALSLATTEALLREDGFSLTSQRTAHIAAYHNARQMSGTTPMTARGWGKSTIGAVERMIQGVPPLEAGQKDGAGNGVVMKMGPLAVWQVLCEVDTATRYEQYDMFTTMTHDSDIARVCTRLHGDVIQALLGPDEPFEDVVRRTAHDVSPVFPDEAALLLRAVELPCQDGEELAARYARGRTGQQYGFYVPETLAIAYDIFLGAKGRMNTAVYRAVNLGGDSDSVASIVASMAVCQTGDMYTEPHEVSHVRNIDMLRRVSQELAWEALKGDT